MRVGEEPAVEDEIGIQGEAVLEAEGHDARVHPRLGAGVEEIDEPLAQLVHAQVARVDDYVGLLTELLQELPLVPDGLEDAPFDSTGWRRRLSS